jgi:Lrp/AsnC family leucine-responsive transcriptional regulator
MRDKLVAFVFLQTKDRKGNIAELLSQIPEAEEVHRIAGEDCYVVRVRVSGVEQLGTLVREKIERIKSVCSTRTTLVLKTFKDKSKNATADRVST